MNMPSVIMVQIADRDWTLEALHCACQLARRHSAKIAIVRMIPVQHTGWLGTDWGYLDFTLQDSYHFADYQAVVEDYGVECMPLLFQYATWDEATLQVAQGVNADIVFAKTPGSVLPFWSRFLRWSFSHQLRHHGREWIEYPVYDAGHEMDTPDLAHSAAML